MRAFDALTMLQSIVTEAGSAGLEVKVLNDEGDLFDIAEIRFSAMNGGEIHIVANSDEDEY